MAVSTKLNMKWIELLQGIKIWLMLASNCNSEYYKVHGIGVYALKIGAIVLYIVTYEAVSSNILSQSTSCQAK